MLFSEIYGSYYQTVAKILSRAVAGTLDGKALQRIVQETAFAESPLTIPDALVSGQWPLLTRDYGTPLLREPAMPLTLLQKRWMKAILLDPRVQLFQPDATGLEDVAPLFRQEWLVYFDRYTDGDDYGDPGYISRFRTILTALREKRQLQLVFRDGRGNRHNTAVSPQYLEYSGKDDRFRLAAEGFRPWIVNLSRIEDCRLLESAAFSTHQDFRHTRSLTLTLTDERGTLERVLLHFSHLEKETRRLDDTHYQLTLHYDQNDETEMLIRILSFGAMVQVIAPESFRDRIRQRLALQSRY
ncbi:MAG: helix-turn-helix transcriptional regulator [Aristaeellaceae bacterium]